MDRRQQAIAAGGTAAALGAGAGALQLADDVLRAGARTSLRLSDEVVVMSTPHLGETVLREIPEAFLDDAVVAGRGITVGPSTGLDRGVRSAGHGVAPRGIAWGPPAKSGLTPQGHKALALEPHAAGDWAQEFAQQGLEVSIEYATLDISDADDGDPESITVSPRVMTPKFVALDDSGGPSFDAVLTRLGTASKPIGIAVRVDDHDGVAVGWQHSRIPLTELREQCERTRSHCVFLLCGPADASTCESVVEGIWTETIRSVVHGQLEGDLPTAVQALYLRLGRASDGPGRALHLEHSVIGTRVAELHFRSGTDQPPSAARSK